MAKNISLDNLTDYDQEIKKYISGHGSGLNVIELTQEEYDALPEVDPKTFYLIKD